MLITIAVVLCHTIAAVPNAPVCREEIIARSDSMQACLVGQPAIADWKAHSIYASEAWTIRRIKCVPGSDYQVRDAI
jgi:hypothetical protein